MTLTVLVRCMSTESTDHLGHNFQAWIEQNVHTICGLCRGLLMEVWVYLLLDLGL